MNFLFHKMPVAALINHARTGSHNHRLTISRGAIGLIDRDMIGRNQRKIMIFQINHLAGQMRQSNGI